MIKSSAIFVHLLLPMAWLLACAPTVPPLSVLGKWHEVKDGETIESIANTYGVDKEEIAELNQVPVYDRLTRQTQLFIPLGKGTPPGDGKPEKTQTVSSANAAFRDNQTTPAAVTATTSAQLIQETVNKSLNSNCGKEGRPCFLWPVKGSILLGFGDRMGADSTESDGIDIQAPRGTAVMVAGNGDVIYSGNAIKGYGNLILVRHENNVITVYAHNERNLVKEGTKVMRGEKIAEVGDSGAASLTLLHFEVRVNETPVDPMLYLPGKE